MKFCFFLYFFLISSFLIAGEPLSLFTSSTNLTSELSGVVKNSDLEPVEILTAKDIKLIGAENVPDLLDYISGVNIYKIDTSSIDFSMRGLPGFYRIQPLVLIDGMEFQQYLYDKVFFYNFPLNIDDIDKVEIIKDPSKFVNGIESPGGVINFVTKKPELLNANYLNTYLGSNKLLNSNFSINNYYKSIYYKVTGDFRKIDKYHSKKRATTKKFITLSTTNFFENSKLFTKFSYFMGDYTFRDFYRVVVNKKVNGFPMSFQFKNEKLFNFIIDYTTGNSNITFYSQLISGKIGHTESNPFNTGYYKLSFKKFFKIKSFSITTGLISSYSTNHISSQGSGKREALILYMNLDYNIFKNLKLSGFIKNERARNLGNELSFKTSIIYSNNRKDFLMKLGYSKNYRNPSILSQYYNLNEKYEFTNIEIPSVIHGNKNLLPEKFYSTFFYIAKKINKLTVKGEFFYNRIYNLFYSYGNMSFFPPKIDIFTANKFDFELHGFETTINYKFNSYLKMQSSYYLQFFNNKTLNIQGDWLVPKYKIMSIIFFNTDAISGNIKWTYIPKIHTKCAGESDYLSIVDFNLLKYFYKRKFEVSLNVKNLFKDSGRESTYGDNLGRSVILKLRYNF